MRGEVFYFDYGCLAFWGLSERQEREVLGLLVSGRGVVDCMAQVYEQALLPLLGGENAHATPWLQLLWAELVTSGRLLLNSPCTSIAQVGPALVDALPASEWEVEQFQVGRARPDRLAELLVGSVLRVAACCCCASLQQVGVRGMVCWMHVSINTWLPACPPLPARSSITASARSRTSRTTQSQVGASCRRLAVGLRLGCASSHAWTSCLPLCFSPRSPHHCATLPPAALDPQSTTGYGTTTS